MKVVQKSVLCYNISLPLRDAWLCFPLIMHSLVDSLLRVVQNLVCSVLTLIERIFERMEGNYAGSFDLILPSFFIVK